MSLIIKIFITELINIPVIYLTLLVNRLNEFKILLLYNPVITQ